MGSCVGPDVTSTFLPARSPAAAAADLTSGTERGFVPPSSPSAAATISSGSAMRPGPCSGSAMAPALGPTTATPSRFRSEEHTSELQSHSDLVCRLLLEKKKRVLVGERAGRTKQDTHII